MKIENFFTINFAQREICGRVAIRKQRVCSQRQNERKARKTKTKLVKTSKVREKATKRKQSFYRWHSSSLLRLLHFICSPSLISLSPPPSLSLSKQRVKNKIKCHIISPDWLEASSPPASDEPRDGHCRPCAHSPPLSILFFGI